MTKLASRVLGWIAVLVALTLAAGVASADTELVITSVFTIREDSSLTSEGDLDLPAAASDPLAEGWFQTGLLWLYLDTNRPVTVTAAAYPYTHDEGAVELPTQLQGAHGRRDDPLQPFGWLPLRAEIGPIIGDLPGRYTAWLQLQVLRSGYADRTGRYTATVVITVSD